VDGGGRGAGLIKSPLPTPEAAILLVDDTPANLVALETILEPLGQRLVSARSGKEALRLLLDEDFALILLDVRMGEMNGFETARLIRARRHTEHVPIIFVTAFDRAETDMRSGYELGAADFIFKPFQADALRAKVGVFVDLFQKTEAMRLQAEQLRQMELREARRRLEQAERGRAQAEARFENILDLAPDGIFAVDAEDRLVLFNKGAERLFGHGAADVYGTLVSELVPGGVPRSGAGPFEVTARRHDGSEFPAELSVGEQAFGQEAITTVICRDVTERQRNEERVRQLNRELAQRLKHGVEMVADLAASLNPREVTGRLLTRVVEAVGADQGTLLRLDEGRLVVQDSFDLQGRLAPPRGTEFTGGRVLQRALKDRKVVLNGAIEGGRLPARTRDWLQGVRQTAALPLVVGEEVAAVLLLSRRRDVAFGERELETLELIGNVATVALRNAQLFTAAEAASASKSEFLNMAAHELRTPLSVVVGYLSMLADGTLGSPSEAWSRPIDILNIKAGELNKLVDALLMAARMEAGAITGEAEDVDLVRLAREALQRAEARANLLGGQLILEKPAAPVQVEADPVHVGRILDNLVNNALTYTMDQPWVRVTVSPDAVVTVEDHGLGIPDDHRGLVFERFFRVNDPILPPQPGTGLGLYISRELARRYGGEVALEESVPGSGSRFVLRLQPAFRSARRRAAEASPAGSRQAG
jgi:signal transduction histidine kinase/DNA-binding response OmpR family regulator